MNDFKTLFKGGDAVDVCIRPSVDENDNNATEGDVRFVCGSFEGENIVVEMREKNLDIQILRNILIHLL